MGGRRAWENGQWAVGVHLVGAMAGFCGGQRGEWEVRRQQKSEASSGNSRSLPDRKPHPLAHGLPSPLRLLTCPPACPCPPLLPQRDCGLGGRLSGGGGPAGGGSLHCLRPHFRPQAQQVCAGAAQAGCGCVIVL